MLLQPTTLNNSLFESTSFLYQNLTLREPFPRSFSKPIWQQISQINPKIFISQQQNLLDALLNDQDKFLSYFRLFYNNHLIIYEWHVLASEKHLEIRDYVFTELLRKTSADYKTILRDNMSKLAKSSIKKEPSKYSAKYFLRSSNQSPKPSSSEIKKCDTTPNSIHQSAVFTKKSITLQQLSEDYHALFIKTLDACDGFKYIHYDFCKHQKGYENRNVYNRFIRVKGKRNNSCERLNTLYEQLRDTEEGENKFKNESNVFNKTLSFLKPATVHNNLKFARFQLIPFDINQANMEIEGQNRRSQIKSKGSKTLVMKKMPHQFGRQKKSTAFQIKVHKSPVLTQSLRM